MTVPARLLPARTRLFPILCLPTIAAATLLSLLILPGYANPQCPPGLGGQADAPNSVRGTVLNRLTREPLSRALVYSPDQQHATMTDDRGHFEFKLPPQDPEPQENLPATSDSYVVRRTQFFRNFLPSELQARKPGFLPSENRPPERRTAPNQSEITIYLDPESLIIGHVNLPGSEGDSRILLELHRREIREGQQHWAPAGTFWTWADGEFRFSNLAPGTYKLLTHEQLDRDTFTAPLGRQHFGFPPVFYPGVSDFSAASPIHLAAGATFQASFSPTSREYYAVKFPVGNDVAGQWANINVYPLGHPGPGYSLGYSPTEQLIEGMLPDGNYTLQVNTQGQPGSTGVLNFSVHGAPLEGPAVNLLPNPSLTVNVSEEFSAGQSVFDEGPEKPALGTWNGESLRQIHVQVMLTPMEELDAVPDGVSQPIEGTLEHTLLIPNIRPGRYHVHVESGIGFAASILSGGTDLLRQPLVVAMGGSNSPIELTLRDDGAEVTGTIEEATKTDCRSDQSDDSRPPYFVYFVPVEGSTGQFRQTLSGPDGAFRQEQLPPGAYRVLAFDRNRDDLAYATEEALHKFESQAKLIHVTAGEKEHLRLKIGQGSDSQ